MRAARVGLIGAVALAVAVAVAGVAAWSALPPLPDSQYARDQFLIGLVHVPVGAWIAWRRPGHRIGWLLVLAGTAMWSSFAGQPVIAWLVVHERGGETLLRTLLALAIWGWIAARGILLTLVPACYPAGRPSGAAARALWWLSAGAVVVTCVAHARLYTMDAFQGVEPVGTRRLAELVEPWGTRVMLACGLAALTGMVVRVVSGGREARRVHGPIAVVATVLLLPTVESLASDVAGRHLVQWAGELEAWTTMALPIALAVGVVRHGVLDIRVVVRRGTVFAVSAVLLGVIYAALVWSISIVAGGGAPPAVLGAAVVAFLTMPVYVRARQLVERRLFGRRSQPGAVIAAVTGVVEQAPQGVDALALAARTIGEQLALPYVAVTVRVEGEELPMAAWGEVTSPVESFPLATGDGPIGTLVLAGRTEVEPLGAVELALVHRILPGVAALAANVALIEQLSASRRLLVEAREEERRRIRRDLHDGLGPTLASVCLGLGAAAERLDGDLGALLTRLEEELTAAVDDIRRLVYDLRPPALDELGLAGAVRDHARQLADGASLAVVVDAQEHPSLPAAVEVAAYRIALEALTNVARHADASNCWVRIRLSEHGVEIEVEDDGAGLAEERRDGIGLRSMRERALELGGRFWIRGRVPCGTVVGALLPVVGGLL